MVVDDQLLLTVEAADSMDELTSLLDWLGDVDTLRGRVSGVAEPPPAGKLGPLLMAVEVALGPGGAATAFATALVAWIRHRSSAVTVIVTKPDGTHVEFKATHVRGLTADELRAQADIVRQFAERDEAGTS